MGVSYLWRRVARERGMMIVNGRSNDFIFTHTETRFCTQFQHFPRSLPSVRRDSLRRIAIPPCQHTNSSSCIPKYRGNDKKSQISSVLPSERVMKLPVASSPWSSHVILYAVTNSYCDIVLLECRVRFLLK